MPTRFWVAVFWCISIVLEITIWPFMAMAWGCNGGPDFRSRTLIAISFVGFAGYIVLFSLAFHPFPHWVNAVFLVLYFLGFIACRKLDNRSYV